jgi:flagellar biosynthesis protein FliR
VAVPLFVSAVLFLLFAMLEWRRLPVVARVYLGVATAFAVGSVVHPGMSIKEALDHTRDGVTWLLALARVAGLTAVLVSAVTFLRSAPFHRR